MPKRKEYIRAAKDSLLRHLWDKEDPRIDESFTKARKLRHKDFFELLEETFRKEKDPQTACSLFAAEFSKEFGPLVSEAIEETEGEASYIVERYRVACDEKELTRMLVLATEGLEWKEYEAKAFGKLKLPKLNPWCSSCDPKKHKSFAEAAKGRAHFASFVRSLRMGEASPEPFALALSEEVIAKAWVALSKVCPGGKEATSRKIISFFSDPGRVGKAFGEALRKAGKPPARSSSCL